MANHGLLVLGMQKCFNTHKESLRTQVCQLPKNREHSLCLLREQYGHLRLPAVMQNELMVSAKIFRVFKEYYVTYFYYY